MASVGSFNVYGNALVGFDVEMYSFVFIVLTLLIFDARIHYNNNKEEIRKTNGQTDRQTTNWYKQTEGEMSEEFDRYTEALDLMDTIQTTGADVAEVLEQAIGRLGDEAKVRLVDYIVVSRPAEAAIWLYNWIEHELERDADPNAPGYSV